MEWPDVLYHRDLAERKVIGPVQKAAREALMELPDEELGAALRKMWSAGNPGP